MEHLIIRNFGPIKDIDINLKKINVFIGEQGVGKSTIAKLLSCLRDVSLYDMILNEERRLIDGIFSIYGIQNYFSKETYIEYFDGEDLTVKYDSEKFGISSKTRSKAKLKAIISATVNQCLRDTLLRLGVDEKDMTKPKLADLMKKHRRVLASNLRFSFYCPAERGIVGSLSASMASLMISEVPLPDTLMEYMSFFEKAKNHFKTYEFPFLNAKYQLKDGEDMVLCGDSDVPVSLRYSSSGMQSIIPLLMVMDYCVSENYFTSFTIEEPELNLFPTNQLQLLRQILAKTNTDQCKVGTWTLTTHSPYILSILNISLLGGLILEKFPQAAEQLAAKLPVEFIVKPDEIAVYSLDHKSNGTPDCVNIIDDQSGMIKANYLDTVSDVLSGEFNQLYKMYLSFLRKSN